MLESIRYASIPKTIMYASTPKTIKYASTPKTDRYASIKYEGQRVITIVVEGASDYHVKWKLNSPALNPVEFVPVTSLHCCEHCSRLIARLFRIIIISGSGMQ